MGKGNLFGGKANLGQSLQPVIRRGKSDNHGCNEMDPKKAEVGYHKITWEPEFGGMGLTKEHEKAF